MIGVNMREWYILNLTSPREGRHPRRITAAILSKLQKCPPSTSPDQTTLKFKLKTGRNPPKALLFTTLRIDGSGRYWEGAYLIAGTCTLW